MAGLKYGFNVFGRVARELLINMRAVGPAVSAATTSSGGSVFALRARSMAALGVTSAGIAFVLSSTQDGSSPGQKKSTSVLVSDLVKDMLYFKSSSKYSDEKFNKLSRSIAEQLVGRNQDVSPELLNSLLEELQRAVLGSVPASLIKKMAALAAHVGNISSLEVLVAHFGSEAVRKDSWAAEYLDLPEERKASVQDLSDQFSGLGRIKREGFVHAVDRMRAHQREGVISDGRLAVTGVDPEADFLAVSKMTKQLHEVEGRFSRLVVIDADDFEGFSKFLDSIKLYAKSHPGEEFRFDFVLTGGHFTYGQLFVSHLKDDQYKADMVYFDSLGADPGYDPLGLHMPLVARSFPHLTYFVCESVLQYAPKGCSIFAHEMLNQAMHSGHLKDLGFESYRDYAARNTVLTTYYNSTGDENNEVPVVRKDGGSDFALKSAIAAHLFVAPPGYRRLTQSFSRRVDHEMMGYVRHEDDGLYYFEKLPVTAALLQGHQGLNHHSPELQEEMENSTHKGKDETHAKNLGKHTERVAGRPVNKAIAHKIEAMRPKVVGFAAQEGGAPKTTPFSVGAFHAAAEGTLGGEESKKGPTHGVSDEYGPTK